MMDEEWITLGEEEDKKEEIKKTAEEGVIPQKLVEKLVVEEEKKEIQIKPSQKLIIEENRELKIKPSNKWCHVFTRLGVCHYGEKCIFRHMKNFEERREAIDFVSRLYDRNPPCRRGHCSNLSSKTTYPYCSRCRTLVNTSRYVLQKVFISALK